MKKTRLILFTLLVFVFIVAGCGSDEANKKNENSEEQNNEMSQNSENQTQETPQTTETTTDNRGSENVAVTDNSAVTGGNENTVENTQHSADAVATGNGSYEQITQEKAKEIMDSEEPAVILDVRTYDEYNQGHIDGALCIPVEVLSGNGKAGIEQMIPRKDQYILVYCRSGNRSKTASQILADMGYTNVKEFGGINDWQYGTVVK